MQAAGWLPPLMGCFKRTMLAPPLKSDGMEFQILRVGDLGPVFVRDEKSNRLKLSNHVGDKAVQVEASKAVPLFSVVQWFGAPLVACAVIDGFKSVWCVWLIIYYFVAMILSLVFGTFGSYTFCMCRWGEKVDIVLAEELANAAASGKKSKEES